MTPEQWTQILTISPAAACVILVVVVFLRHQRTQSGEFLAHLTKADKAFNGLVERIDQAQAARDDRITTALDANTRVTSEIHGMLVGRAARSDVRINGAHMAGGSLTMRPSQPWAPEPGKPDHEP